MKIGIVGTGAVGSTAAYAMLVQGIASELVLVDKNVDLAEAHVQDLLHATPFTHPVHVCVGDFSMLRGCAIVVIAAGVAQARPVKNGPSFFRATSRYLPRSCQRSYATRRTQHCWWRPIRLM